MITYVNTVFVSNVAQGDSPVATIAADASAATKLSTLAGLGKGQFILLDVDTNTSISAATTRFKIGMGTGKVSYDHNGNLHNDIKWSNIINVDDIKGWTAKSYAADTEDTIYIDFGNLAPSVLNELNDGGKRIITRLTFKDLPTRYRKWTESYEYVTAAGDTVASIATNIAKLINKQWKRARVVASVGEMNSTSASADATVGTKYYHADANWNDADNASANNNTIKLVAMPYDDDDSVDSINWANKVRFNANVYYTDPGAEGWESLNKHYPTGVVITKVPGQAYDASAKLVRDREAQAMGYEGILNRGEGTWPIIKPAMNTDLSKHYNVVTIEFENTYHTADDLFRKTKQAVEIYMVGSVNDATSGTIPYALKSLTSAVVDTNKE